MPYSVGKTEINYPLPQKIEFFPLRLHILVKKKERKEQTRLRGAQINKQMRRIIPCSGEGYEENKVKQKDRDRSGVQSYFGVDGQKRFLRTCHLS